MIFSNYLIQQSRLHPSMEAQDAAKLCYQAAFGAEHLLTDTARARRMLQDEFQRAEEDSSLPLYESISQRQCRINLRSWKARHLPEQWLWNMFFPSVSCPGEKDEIEIYFADVSRTAGEGLLPFSSQDWENFLNAYRAKGIAPLHHSEAYRAAEKPSYRIVRAEYIRALPILERMAEADGSFVIAIDGRCASGKTTLASLISQISGAGLVHMDDFFLPVSMRSPARLSQPGGNVHYERVASQVLPHIRNKNAFSYPRWDCSADNYGEDRLVAASPFRIVEGAYSMHPQLGDYADLRVFSDIDAQEQSRRILLREGAEYAQVFHQRWIPMEESYIAHFHIDETADLVI